MLRTFGPSLALTLLALASCSAFHVPSAAGLRGGAVGSGHGLGIFGRIQDPPSCRLRSNDGKLAATIMAATEDSGAFDRRRLLSASFAAALGLGAAATSAPPAFADAAPLPSTSPSRGAPSPVAVFGANGQTGVRVVDRLVSRGLSVRSIFHHAAEGGSMDTIRGIPIESRVAAIENEDEVAEAVAGTSAVICVVGLKAGYGAGAKSDWKEEELAEGTPAQVYAVGYRDLARQCIANNVKHLVILDSVCTVESDTCSSMAMGEEALRDLYAKAPEGLTYTIVRSGQLYNGESRGPEQIEVNQGGDKSGVISRQDMAELLVEVAINGNAADKATLEAYYTDSAQPRDMMRSLDICEQNGLTTAECFFGKGAGKRKNKDGKTIFALDDAFKSADKGTTVFPTGREKHSSGPWSTLISNLAKDEPKVIDIATFGESSG